MAAAKKTVKPVAVAAPATAPKAEKVEETTAKKVETPAATVKTEEKAKEAVEAKKEPVKKAPAKKTPAKKETKTAAAKKAPVKKGEPKSEIHVQFAGKSFSEEDLIKIAKDVWKFDLKQKVGDLNSIELYVKPEEKTVYYVMNKEFTGSFAI